MTADKHAYLIIAHHEFEVLQALISALDDERNDIFIHIDKKVRDVPQLIAHRAGLELISDRIDVRWGHVSQIAAEYALFEASHHHQGANYGRYHLISGTHMPLKKQDELHAYFEQLKDHEVLSYIYTTAYEANFKINRFHFLVRFFKNQNSFIERFVQLIWHVFIKLQYLLQIQKRKPLVSTKANNWVSLTPLAVAALLPQKSEILKLFRYSFCADEFFVPYVLEKSSFQFKLINDERLLYNDFVGSTPRVISNDDYDFLITSDYLFARKFSAQNLAVVHKILGEVKTT